MAIELECKVRVESLATVRERLKAATGAEFVGRVLEENRLFDREDGSLRRAGCGLRVRSTRVVEGTAQSPTLTYKGPRAPGPFKRREEIELQIADAATMGEILHALGYSERVIFEKRRESWRLPPCRVELDELPRLGTFVEVEGPSEAAVREALTTLAIADREPVSQTYVSMVVETGTADQALPIVLRFGP